MPADVAEDRHRPELAVHPVIADKAQGIDPGTDFGVDRLRRKRGDDIEGGEEGQAPEADGLSADAGVDAL